MIAAGRAFRGSRARGGLNVRHRRRCSSDKDSPLGRLQAMGAGDEGEQHQDGGRAEERRPQRPGPGGHAGVGRSRSAAASASSRLGIDQLKLFVPATFSWASRRRAAARRRTGWPGLSVSKVEGIYGDHAQKHVTLEITHSGGASGLIGMAGWMNLQGEREDDSGFEKTGEGRRPPDAREGVEAPRRQQRFHRRPRRSLHRRRPGHGRWLLELKAGGLRARSRQARSDEVGRRRQVKKKKKTAGVRRSGALSGRGRPRAAGGSRPRRGPRR